MPENRNDDAGQSGGEPNGFDQLATGPQQYGQAPEQTPSGEQPAYGQDHSYGQPQPYGQQTPYGQGQPYGQPAPYGQQTTYGQEQPYGQQPPYGTPNYGYPGTYQAPAQKPGKALGIGGLVLSCLFFLPYASVAGLILSIIGLVKSRKANERNGPALAGIIIGAIVFLLTLLATILIFVFAADVVMNIAEVCAEYGTGTHTIEI